MITVILCIIVIKGFLIVQRNKPFDNDMFFKKKFMYSKLHIF
jgi:hypothetical protein